MSLVCHRWGFYSLFSFNRKFHGIFVQTHCVPFMAKTRWKMLSTVQTFLKTVSWRWVLSLTHTLYPLRARPCVIHPHYFICSASDPQCLGSCINNLPFSWEQNPRLCEVVSLDESHDSALWAVATSATLVLRKTSMAEEFETKPLFCRVGLTHRASLFRKTPDLRLGQTPPC